MDNEEKILGILETMQNQMGSMQSQMGSMQSQMDSMEKRMDAMQETLTRVSMTQENVVLPRLQLLAEGHSTMMDMMPKKSRVEALEEDVAILKSAMEVHSIAIAELKAAK